MDTFDYRRYQDVLGQMTCLQTYTNIAVGFHLEQNASREGVAQELQNGARKLTDAFPWLPGHVVRDGSGPGKTGLSKIEMFPPGERDSIVSVKDCSEIVPSFEEIIAAGGPISMLDGKILSKEPAGFGMAYDSSAQKAAVLEIQANFIKGGLILTFAGNHLIMDMNGMAQLIRLFAKVLRGGSLNDEEVNQGNRDRRNLVRLLGPDEKRADLTPFTVVPHPPPPFADESSPSPYWTYFHCSGTKLKQLKSEVMDKIRMSKEDPETAQAWVSTDDVLTAFISQHILRARISRLGMPKAGTRPTVSRALNGRRFLETPVPKEYMGHVVTVLDTCVPVDSLLSTDNLVGLSLQLRREINGFSTRVMHSVATAMAENDDKGVYGLCTTVDGSQYDVVFSSWCGSELYQQDFGAVLGGKPQLVKRQNVNTMEGLVYLMPKTDDGDVDILVCLRPEDFKSLQDNEEFMSYISYVG